MLPKNFMQFDAIVKNIETGEEIVRTAVHDQIKDQDIIGIDCDPALFQGIEKVDVVLFNSRDAFEYHGTVRKVLSMEKDVAIALYKGKNVRQREQARYSAVTEIQVMVHMSSQKTRKNESPFYAEMTDISTGGAGIQTEKEIFAVGDCFSFYITNHAIDHPLFARAVRVFQLEDLGLYRIGCVLLTEREAKDAGLR